VQERPVADQRTALGFERLVFFSDAVFAIVITLLVLPLTAEVELPGAGSAAHHVAELWPRILNFVVGFLVIGQFWLGHHRVFGHLRRYDPVLLWLNLLSLLAVAFLQFPTALLGGYSTEVDRFPVVFYAASLTVTSLTFTATWLYAVHAGLVDETEDPRALREVTLRSLAASAVFAVSIAAAFLGLVVAAVFWVVLIPVARALVVRLSRRAAVRPGR
jgi:uncharacterized membrane protein